MSARSACGSDASDSSDSTVAPASRGPSKASVDAPCGTELQLAQEMTRRRSTPLPERRAFFLAQCLRWHPDKNVGEESHAKNMFQVLQEKKVWFLSDK